jgi:hypothetical protein
MKLNPKSAFQFISQNTGREIPLSVVFRLENPDIWTTNNVYQVDVAIEPDKGSKSDGSVYLRHHDPVRSKKLYIRHLDEIEFSNIKNSELAISSVYNNFPKISLNGITLSPSDFTRKDADVRSYTWSSDEDGLQVVLYRF